MPRRSAAMLLAAAVAGSWLAAVPRAGAADEHASPANAQLDELRNTFTLGGKPVPPLVFRDLGDGNLADSTDIIDSVDIASAIGSNLYGNPIKASSGWQTQQGVDGAEEGYDFIGTTQNGLVVVVTRFSGGGSGVFYVLHILDLKPGRAFDANGKPYDRIDLKTVRAVPLGDRWTGVVSIKGDTLRIESTGNGAEAGSRELSAERP